MTGNDSKLELMRMQIQGTLNIPFVISYRKQKAAYSRWRNIDRDQLHVGFEVISMTDDLEKEFEKSRNMAQRRFRKDVDGFRTRRRLELEDLLRTEQEKSEELQDAEKIEWLLLELKRVEESERS
jgi:hypothetical protein